MYRYIKAATSPSGYMYVLKHGTGPGTMPKDVTILKSWDKGWLVIAVLDRFLTWQELDRYDIPSETELDSRLRREGLVAKIENGQWELYDENGDLYEPYYTSSAYGTSVNTCKAITSADDQSNIIVLDMWMQEADGYYGDDTTVYDVDIFYDDIALDCNCHISVDDEPFEDIFYSRYGIEVQYDDSGILPEGNYGDTEYATDLEDAKRCLEQTLTDWVHEVHPGAEVAFEW